MARTVAIIAVLSITWIAVRKMATTGPVESGEGSENTITVVGSVVDDVGPIPNARVRIKGSPVFTISDEDGVFHLDTNTRSRLITAAKPGYLIGSARDTGKPLVIKLAKLPLSDFSDYRWVDPAPNPTSIGNCGNCHEELYQQWQASGHARGTANRHFMNLYTGTDWNNRPNRGWSLLGEYPRGAGVCGSCHAPAVDSEAQLDNLRHVSGVAAGGVQCDFCHKVQDVAIENVGLQHGRFAMTLLRPQSGQVFFGPLDDVDRGEDAYSTLQSQSQYCAACHEGTLFGVPVYTTYSEWLESPAHGQGIQCQSCHMTPDGELHNVAPGVGGLERDPQTLASHELLPGGHKAMLKRTIHLSAQLSGNSPARKLQIKLWVDDVGHRVPTGFIDRHLILTVDVSDARGQAIEIVDGPRLPPPVGDELSATRGVLFAKLLTDPNGQAPVPFWRAGVTTTDNRLAPGQPSITSYLLPKEAKSIRVRLLYRRFWKMIAREKDWPDDEIVVIESSYEPTATGLQETRT